jgi:hypothetical protein
MLCQQEFDAAGWSGDSGAPVFRWYQGGSTVQLSGVVWAGFQKGFIMYPLLYSPQIYVQWELTRADWPITCPGGGQCWSLPCRLPNEGRRLSQC